MAEKLSEGGSDAVMHQSEYRESDFESLSQHGISHETFSMITAKEKLEDEAKQRNLETLEKMTQTRELQEHLRVAEALR